MFPVLCEKFLTLLRFVEYGFYGDVSDGSSLHNYLFSVATFVDLYDIILQRMKTTPTVWQRPSIALQERFALTMETVLRKGLENS